MHLTRQPSALGSATVRVPCAPFAHASATWAINKSTQQQISYKFHHPVGGGVYTGAGYLVVHLAVLQMLHLLQP